MTCKKFGLTIFSKVSCLSARLMMQLKMCAISLRISREVSLQSKSTNFSVIICLRRTIVAAHSQEQKLANTQQASLRKTGSELIINLKMLSRKLVFNSADAQCSISSPSTLPNILKVSLFISTSGDSNPLSKLSTTSSLSKNQAMDSWPVMLEYQQKALKATYDPLITYGSKASQDIFPLKIWLNNTHMSVMLPQAIVSISFSLPIMWFPAAMSAMVRISLDRERQSLRSRQNYLVRAAKLGYCCSVAILSMCSDQWVKWGSSSMHPGIRVWQTILSLLRQKDMVVTSMGGRGVGIGAMRECLMAVLIGLGQR